MKMADEELQYLTMDFKPISSNTNIDLWNFFCLDLASMLCISFPYSLNSPLHFRKRTKRKNSEYRYPKSSLFSTD